MCDAKRRRRLPSLCSRRDSEDWVWVGGSKSVTHWRLLPTADPQGVDRVWLISESGGGAVVFRWSPLGGVGSQQPAIGLGALDTDRYEEPGDHVGGCRPVGVVEVSRPPVLRLNSV